MGEVAEPLSVLVKTRTWDIHGRYVGHVFYSLKPLPRTDFLTRGAYLNQELLDQDLAVAV